MTYQAPGITVRSEGGTSVVTADQGASALHLANTITFAVSPSCALDKVETDENGRLVLTFVAGTAAFVVTPLGRCTVPADPPRARRPTG
jgi:hypothetical protein